MDTFYITKSIKATSISDALTKESTGEIVAIEKAQEEGDFNTHAIGFDVQTPSEEYED